MATTLVDVKLTPVLRNGRVEIDDVSGNSAPHLPRRSGAHRFEFELINDQTGLNVRFQPLGSLLDCEDDRSACPPAQGNNSNQIVGLARPSDTRARFTDNNNNRPPTQPNDMPVSYQLNFECNDPSKHPITFDPIIINGGQ